MWPHGLRWTRLPVLHCPPEFAQTRIHWVGDAIQPYHSPSGSDSKESAYNAGDPGFIQDSLEKEMATNSSILENSMGKGDWWATVRGVTKSQTWLSDWSKSISHINDVISVFFLQLPNFIHSLKHLIICHMGGSLPGAEIKRWMDPMRTLPSGSFWWRREHVSKFTKDARLIFTHTLTYTCTLPHSHTVVHTHTFSHTSLHTLLLNLQQYSCRIGLYEGNLGVESHGHFILLFLAVPGVSCDTEDLCFRHVISGSLTRDWIHVPCVESAGSSPLDHQGGPHGHFKWTTPAVLTYSKEGKLHSSINSAGMLLPHTLTNTEFSSKFLHLGWPNSGIFASLFIPLWFINLTVFYHTFVLSTFRSL